MSVERREVGGGQELNAAAEAATQGGRSGGRMGSLASRTGVDFGCILARGESGGDDGILRGGPVVGVSSREIQSRFRGSLAPPVERLPMSAICEASRSGGGRRGLAC
jgi:hypothetical protein